MDEEARRAARKRFIREARLTGQLAHPGVVPVHELGLRADGTLYYTMARVQGRRLSDAIADCKTLYDRLALVPRVLDVCHAVGHAHRRDVVHRDIHPANVVLGEHGETVLLDWGLALAKGQRDLRGAELARDIQRLQDADAGLAVEEVSLQTPAYLSPELARGDLEAVDARSDVWSLGAVLYEVLTGRTPFRGETAWETLAKVCDEPVPPPSSLHEGIPAELAAICLRCLERDPRKRYESAEALAQELAAFQTGGRIRAYEYGSGELLRRFIARNKLLTSSLVLLVGLLVAGSVIIYREYESASAARTREHQARRRAERMRQREQRARRQQEDLRRQAQRGQRKAHKHLAEGYLKQSRRLLRARRHADAGVFAAAALLHNPHHPRSPWRFPHAGPPSTIRENALLAGARTVLYRVTLEQRLSHHRTLPARDIRGWRVAFSADGGYLAYGGQSTQVWLWSLSDHKLIGPFEAPAKPIIAVAFSPDGKTLAAAGGGGAVRLWSVPDGHRIATLKAHVRLATAVDFSPDGRTLATAGTDRQIRLWDLKTFRVVKDFTHPNISVWAVRFSPDGKLIASAGWKEGEASRVRLWEVKTERALATLSDHLGPVWGVDFSPDGKRLVSVGLDKVVRIYDTRKARLLQVLRGHQGDITDVAFSPDGKRLATVSTDRTLRLWETRSWRALDTAEAHAGQIWGVAFSPDGRRIATSSWDERVKLWRVRLKERGLRLRAAEETPVWAGFADRGRLLAAAGLKQRVTVWDARKRERLRRFDPDMRSLRTLALSPATPILAAVHRNRTLWLWDLRTGKRTWILSAQARSDTRSLAFHPLGKLLAAGDRKGRVRIWDLQKREPRFTTPAGQGSVEALAYDPGGARIAVGREGARAAPITLWSANKPKKLSVLDGYKGGVTSLAWSPDGKRLAAACQDWALRVWDTATGKLAQTLVGHGDDVLHVQWSPDGGTLLSVSRDDTLRLWRARNGLLIHGYRLSQPALRAPFWPDGQGFVVPSAEGLRVLPRRSKVFERDPRDLLKKAQQRAGRELRGFSLHTPR